ncbi:MAG: conserved hypothetical protein [Candidatus Desulfovibrio kirbyi]|jgi:hypothetical protein|uniref:HdeA/HdeB family protein n=1 Tax=Candidatus Desulfovibrio kirbyi TaxID=2696086 RepID=A0A6L2R6Q3_9BACT|nr:hypothetical protein [Desulfovibrio sp.]GFH63215.1 MAG: conserved hypothetical protein [Candidatus Desulfovibrio kirbyi]
MKKWFAAACLLGMLSLPVYADDKIDPNDFICAELMSLPLMDADPALFEVLQIDGYVSALLDKTDADAQRMLPLMQQVYNGCQSKPASTVLSLWQAARMAYPDSPNNSAWKADKTTCADYSANEEDGSGFVIWLDGYNRQKNPQALSVLESDDALKAYLEACANRPESLMLEIMQEKTKQ